MTRGLLAVALAGGLLAGCATPQDTFSAGPPQPAGFEYVAESYDLFPTRRYEGEVRRLQDLQQYLASANLCPLAYTIDSREESVGRGAFLTEAFQGAIYRVTYRGHCSATTPQSPPSASDTMPAAPEGSPTALETTPSAPQMVPAAFEAAPAAPEMPPAAFETVPSVPESRPAASDGFAPLGAPTG